ncbi:hypothetical protein FW774_01710 (plasmid) [Pedobacter sp. BS3]|uniref:hypothetical protein n=1 Tax=Pedobacter sp. BS3 TaxID=2567937 RepID=UPI0011EDE253|nr:hypothetical protein [Pedobacter sp. BS3]TZF85813.1 hypothetical protein FW774_01710 [Pedobacter sp. BS3]
MKKYILEVNLLLIIIVASLNAYSQAGLNKSKEDLLNFIKRPAYADLYPEVTIADTSIVTFSSDFKKAEHYHLNAYKRCVMEVMSEKIEYNNYESIMSFFVRYLKACNYEPSLEIDNKYVNSSKRIIAYIEKNDEWLNIVFKKY